MLFWTSPGFMEDVVRALLLIENLLNMYKAGLTRGTELGQNVVLLVCLLSGFSIELFRKEEKI